MLWTLSHRADGNARIIADRHYNRQKIGSPQFVPPGGCCVFYRETLTGDKAFWVTSTPFGQYVKHAWPGAWICSAFRNENAGRASDLIRDALAATLFCAGPPPVIGLVTFLDTAKVQPITRRGKKVWGYTWIQAGFKEVGRTKGNLLAFQILPEDMPPPAMPVFNMCDYDRPMRLVRKRGD